MPACDNFKIWVLQCPDSHSWRDGAGQGAEQHTQMLDTLACQADISCSHAHVKWVPSWETCCLGYLGILCFLGYPRNFIDIFPCCSRDL